MSIYFSLRAALRLKLQSSNNFQRIYRFEFKLYRMVELCVPNYRCFLIFDVNGYWWEKPSRAIVLLRLSQKKSEQILNLQVMVNKTFPNLNLDDATKY